MKDVDKLIVRNSAMLTAAPNKGRPQSGTTVSVKAHDALVPPSWPSGLRKILEPPSPDHMYVEYDDGQEQLIARGGPSSHGLALFRDGLTGRLRTVAEVTPARQSRDYGTAQRTLAQTFLPGVTARQAAQPAYDVAAKARRGDNLYGGLVNSNSVAAAAAEPAFGRRIGNEHTWGYKTRLGDGELPESVRRSQQALGQGFGSTQPGMLLYRLGEELGKRSPKIPMLPGY